MRTRRAHRRLLAAGLGALLASACSDEAPAPLVPGTTRLAVTPEPGPPPHERLPVATLWVRGADGWRAGERVVGVAPGGRGWVRPDGALVWDGRVVDEGVIPPLSVGPDGSLAYTRGAPGDTDVWRRGADGAVAQVTRDGQSDRPFFLPDGRLGWVSAAGSGIAGFVVEGERWTNARGAAQWVPVPARLDALRVEGGALIYDAGEGEWALDLRTRQASPL